MSIKEAEDIIICITRPRSTRFGLGEGLPREGVGAKKFGMSFETQGNQTCLAGHPGILPGYPGIAEKFETKKFVFNCWPHTLNSF